MGQQPSSKAFTMMATAYTAATCYAAYKIGRWVDQQRDAHEWERNFRVNELAQRKDWKEQKLAHLYIHSQAVTLPPNAPET